MTDEELLLKKERGKEEMAAGEKNANFIDG